MRVRYGIFIVLLLTSSHEAFSGQVRCKMTSPIIQETNMENLVIWINFLDSAK